MCNIYRLYVYGLLLYICFGFFGRVLAFLSGHLPRTAFPLRRPLDGCGKSASRRSRVASLSLKGDYGSNIIAKRVAHWENGAAKAWNPPGLRDSRLYSMLDEYKRDNVVEIDKRRAEMSIAGRVKKIFEELTEYVESLLRLETHAPPIVCLVASCAYLVPYFDVTQVSKWSEYRKESGATNGSWACHSLLSVLATFCR
ncbi:signal peptide-containing protein [Theileria equi strain WA]|uniref:Signal peptide-containing protein n=1 Tax=Theileria equi strain WA TaxID=1537102 RepID=L0AWJ3_THEEQ|nr:signal peptide-containing protein [Theileria equi strain WA]AFZ79905.1 signal peptide-containing protein [Theileria equi strain WA]|eukprot:XP_004829571.1 signal peptide-containing protein [Theileria equi strain WA]